MFNAPQIVHALQFVYLDPVAVTISPAKWLTTEAHINQFYPIWVHLESGKSHKYSLHHKSEILTTVSMDITRLKPAPITVEIVYMYAKNDNEDDLPKWWDSIERTCYICNVSSSDIKGHHKKKKAET